MREERGSWKSLTSPTQANLFQFVLTEMLFVCNRRRTWLQYISQILGVTLQCIVYLIYPCTCSKSSKWIFTQVSTLSFNPLSSPFLCHCHSWAQKWWKWHSIEEHECLGIFPEYFHFLLGFYKIGQKLDDDILYNESGKHKDFFRQQKAQGGTKQIEVKLPENTNAIEEKGVQCIFLFIKKKKHIAEWNSPSSHSLPHK